MTSQQAPLASMHPDAEKYLADIDDDWAGLIARVGPCTHQPKPAQAPYEALARAVAYQQLHPRAGDAIIARLLALFDNRFPTPAQLLAADFTALRACGFSGRKIETLQGIADAAGNGIVPGFDAASAMTDEALIDQLVTLKGIGRWTVEMLLIFNLGRLDILPADDFGVRDGYRRLKSLDSAPTRKIMEQLGAAWQPYRTIAAWYLWRVPRQQA